MDLILRGLVLYVVCTLTQSQLHVTITPSVIDVEDGVSVTVRCSLNLTHYKTNRVYSIMLKRGSELIVVYGYDKPYMPGKHYNIHGVLDQSKQVNFLQVKLENVTCSERGDYSCKMAVRLNSGNANFGPTSSSLKVIGAPTPIQVGIQRSNRSTAVGQAVNITCSALKKTKGSDWLWTFKDVSNQMSESCTYMENVCLFSCFSSMSYTVDGFDQSNVQCRYGGIIKRFSLNSTTNVVKEMETTIEEEISTVEVHVAAIVEEAPTKRPRTHDNDTTYEVYPYGNGKGKKDLLKNILVYSFISVFALLFLVILWLFISDRRRCRRFRKSGHFMQFNKYSENISELTGGQHYLYPDTDTRPPAYVAGHSNEDSALLHHQIHQVNRPHIGSSSTPLRTHLPSHHGHGTQNSEHFSETSYMTPHHVGIASTDGHCVTAECRDMPHHMDRAHTNGHCVNTDFIHRPLHVDRAHTNGHCVTADFIQRSLHVDRAHTNGHCVNTDFIQRSLHVDRAHTNGHCMTASFMDVPHHMDRARSNGHCINAEFMDMPHHVDRACVNGHCMDRNFINVPNHVDIRHLNGTSTDRNSGLSAEHIYDEVDDVRHSAGVLIDPVNSVGNRLENT